DLIDRLRRRKRAFRRMAVGVLERRRAEAVALAASVDDPEERLRRAVPGELRELVDGRDQERRQPAEDLLVDCEHRDPLPRRPPRRERARAQAVAAVGENARAALLVRL